jgi:hypothetical protein
MALDPQQERGLVHVLLDLLPPAKLRLGRSVLQLMVDEEDDEELMEEDRVAIRAGLDSLERHRPVSEE